MPKFVNLIAFLKKLISKEHVLVVMEVPVQVKMKILQLKKMNEKHHEKMAWGNRTAQIREQSKEV